MSSHGLDDERLRDLAREHGTPLYVVDAGRVATQIERLAACFDVVRYAQKANGNLGLLRRMRELGVEIDAVSVGEARRALAAGFDPAQVVYTADLFEPGALEWLERHPVRLNLGSACMLGDVRAAGLEGPLTLRVNPGFGYGHHAKVTTGGPCSKHGIWIDELPAVLDEARALGLVVGGLHVHAGSGGGQADLERPAAVLRELAPRVGDALEVLCAGGGLPAREGPRFDVGAYARAWRAARDAVAGDLGRAVRLEVEPGRFLVAAAGVLVTEVRATKTQGGHPFVLVDAGFHTMARTVLYGAEHRIHVLGRRDGPTRPCTVAGPLCEAADVFQPPRDGRPGTVPLPPVEPGDLLGIHDVGAYGSAMASNYNTHPLPAEVLVEGASARLVRARQSWEDVLAAELACPAPAAGAAPTGGA